MMAFWMLKRRFSLWRCNVGVNSTFYHYYLKKRVEQSIVLHLALVKSRRRLEFVFSVQYLPSRKMLPVQTPNFSRAEPNSN